MQEYFINWLRTYENVYETYYGRYYPILTERVINNDLFLDAYFVWLREKKKQDAERQRDTELKAKYQRDLKGIPNKMEVIEFRPKDD